MAKELVYRVRIEYDSDQAAEGAATIDNTQERAEQSVNNTTAAIRRQQEAQEQASRSTRNYSKVQSNANQTLFSFGDLLNDAQQFQFGFASGTRAIGNNVGFAAEQFSQISQRAGGFQNALSALGSSLLGPGGVILAINAAVTAITVFGDALFDSGEKADEARESIEDYRKEVDFFSTQLEQLTSLQERLFPDQDQLNALRQQLQFSRQIEANLANRLDSTEEERERLEQQVDLFERLQNKSLSVNEAIDRGLISQELGVAILQDRVDIEGTLIQKRNQLQEIQQREEALQNSLTSAQKDQIDTLAEIEGIEAARSTQIFRSLSGLRQQEMSLQSISDFVRRLTELGTQQIGFRGLEDAGPLGLSPEELERREERKKQIRIQKEREAFARIGMTREQGLKQFEQYLVQEQKAKEDTEEAKTRIEKLEQKQRQESMLTAVQASADAIGVIFENSKAASIASAVINAGAAIVRQFKDLPLYAAIPSAALVAAKTAKQIEKIQNVEPGNAGSVSSAGGGGSRQGIQSTEINKRNQAATQGIRSSRGQPINPTFILSGEFDEEVLSIKVENGRKSRISTSNAIQSG